MSNSQQGHTSFRFGLSSRNRGVRSFVSLAVTTSLVFGGMVLAIPAQAEGPEATPEVSSLVTPSLEETTSQVATDHSDDSSPEPVVDSSTAASDPETSTSSESPSPTSTPDADETQLDDPTDVDVSDDPTLTPSVSPSPSPSTLTSAKPKPCPSPSNDGKNVDELEKNNNEKKECAETDESSDVLKEVTLTTGAASLLAGQSVEISGEGWVKDKGVKIVITDSDSKVALNETAIVSEDGKITTSFKLSYEAGGTYSAVATGASTDRVAKTSFEVTPLEVPTIKSEFADYLAGQTVKFTGTGWAADESVEVYVNDREGRTWFMYIKAQVAEDGTIAAEVTLPSYFVAIYDVKATGQTTGRIATTTFTDSQGTITVSKAGDRTGNTSASGLNGAIFDFYYKGTSTDTSIPAGTADYTCTTGVGTKPDGTANPTGECTVGVTWDSNSARRFLVVERSAPAGWSVLSEFKTDSSGSDPYRFNVIVSNGEAISIPGTVSSLPRKWANQRNNPAWPGVCGMNIALLFDESNSISSTEWTQMKDAAKAFVDALTGTPSQIAIFSFASSAPAGTTKPLTWVKTAAEAAAFKTTITNMSQQGGGTNWDAGLYQIAQSSERFDAVLFLTDGDPTFYSNPTLGTGNTTTIQNVEEAVHSANAIKAEGTRMVGVGIGLSTNSAKNLAAVSGPAVGVDYFLPTGFAALEATLKEIARTQCGGTVIVDKQIGSSIPGSKGTDTNGWPFSAQITQNASNTTTTATPSDEKTGVLNAQNGQLQYKFTGGTWPKKVKITELENTAAPGYSLKDIKCTKGDTVVATRVGSNGFIEIPNIGIDDTISCVFLNERNAGSLTLSKTLSGGPANFNGPFTLQYSCTLAGSPAVTGSESVTSGSSKTVSGIGTGYTCVVSEPVLPTAPPGYTFGTPTFTPANATVTIVKNEAVTVTTKNTLTRDLGSFTVVKALSNVGGAVTPATFAIDYQCKIGQTVTKSGTVNVAPGATGVSVSGVPTGSECTITEGALAPISGFTWAPVTYDPREVTVTNTTGTFTVKAVNSITRDLGSFTVVKALSNVGGAVTPATFAIDYQCKIGQTVTKSGTVNVAPGATGVSVSGVPTGSECTITEGALAPISGFTWAPVTYDPREVTVTNTTGTFTVKAVNSITRDLGSLTLSKSLSGGPANFNGPFTLQYSCTLAGSPAVTGSESVTSGSSKTVSGIGTGYTCVVSEPVLPTAPPGYTFGTPTFTPANATVTIVKNEAVTVTTKNTLTRDLGSLTLSKSLSGGPEGYAGPFTLGYSCTLDGSEPLNGSRSVAAGGSATVSQIPTGYECVVSEPVLPTAPTGYTFGAPSFDPVNATVTIVKNEAVTVTTKNVLSRDLGYLQLSKVLTGTPESYNPTFDFSYICTLEGEENITGTVSLLQGETVVTPDGGIPTGYECTVTEDALPGLPANFSWNAPVFTNNQESTPGNVVVIVKDVIPDAEQEVDDNRYAAVTVANSATFTPPIVPPPAGGSGALTVTKSLTGGPAGFAPAFVITYSCSNASSSVSGTLSLASGESATVWNIPVGSSCAVAEANLPAAPEGFTWSAPQITGSPTASIGTGETVGVAVLNTLTQNEDEVIVPDPGTGLPDPVEPDDGEPTIVPDLGTGVPTAVNAGGGARGLTQAVPMWLLLLLILSTAVIVSGVVADRKLRRE